MGSKGVLLMGIKGVLIRTKCVLLKEIMGFLLMGTKEIEHMGTIVFYIHGDKRGSTHGYYRFSTLEDYRLSTHGDEMCYTHED